MQEQPNLEVRVKSLIEVDGLQFKDLNGNGKLDPYEDWRLSPEERAADLVSRMTVDEKAGMMMITTQAMGLSARPEDTRFDGVINDEYKENKSSIFAEQKEYGNTRTIEELNMRHFILRENYSGAEIAEWINAMNEIAEGTRLGIPVLIASNSRNENAERTFGMNDAVGVFTTWPSTLGIAAAALGDKANGGDYSIISEFAETSRKEWAASGIRKGYMYMVDVATDPRWQRTYGTFGEDVDLIVEAGTRLTLGFQGEELNDESVAMTMKHFPGGGPRENGFDPHYKEGKFNVYATPGSLETYHLPPFQAVVDAGSSSIMPYYSIASPDKSAEQTYKGDRMPFEKEPVGFAFSTYFIQELLRDDMGFKGYINSDSGILDKMNWGVEDLGEYERCAKAVNAGVDIIADTNETFLITGAYDHGLITDERLDEANRRLLKEMFVLGLFDGKTYVDPAAADEVVASEESLAKAYTAHQKSTVVLKNEDNVLPLDKQKKLYVEALHKEPEQAVNYTADYRSTIAARHADVELVDQAEDADYAMLFIYPKSGNYFSATPGLLELGLVEDQTNYTLDGDPYQETTVSNIGRVEELAGIMEKNGGKLIISVNTTMPWLFDSIEPLADALVANFETFVDAQMDVLYGDAAPSGKLPLTLPNGAAAIAVDEAGNSVSPNDVPGYDKQQYMPEGLNYAYIDADGNEYIRGFGLTY